MKTRTYVITRQVCVEAAAVPDRTIDALTLATVRAARRYHALPGVQEAYAAWLAAKQAAGLYLDEKGDET